MTREGRSTPEVKWQPDCSNATILARLARKVVFCMTGVKSSYRNAHGPGDHWGRVRGEPAVAHLSGLVGVELQHPWPAAEGSEGPHLLSGL